MREREKREQLSAVAVRWGKLSEKGCTSSRSVAATAAAGAGEVSPRRSSPTIAAETGEVGSEGRERLLEHGAISNACRGFGDGGGGWRSASHELGPRTTIMAEGES